MSKIKENTLSLNLPAVGDARGIQAAIDRQIRVTQSSKQRARSNSSVKEEAPQMKNAKSEILKIPKARQLLNMDKHIYMQDVEKRIELLGDLKQDNFRPQAVEELHSLCKPVKKKTKRHKTNFKIPLTQPNLERMNQIVKSHIELNRKFMNKEVVLLRDYQRTAPFHLDTLKFFDELDEGKRLYKQRFDYEKSNLSKNRLMLQHVILNRNIKRELKLRKASERKQHAKNVMDGINK